MKKILKEIFRQEAEPEFGLPSMWVCQYYDGEELKAEYFERQKQAWEFVEAGFTTKITKGESNDY